MAHGRPAGPFTQRKGMVLAAGLPEHALNSLSSVQSLAPGVGNTLHACMKMPEENLLFCTLMLGSSIKFNKEKTFLIILSLDIFLLFGGGANKRSAECSWSPQDASVA